MWAIGQMATCCSSHTGELAVAAGPKLLLFSADAAAMDDLVPTRVVDVCAHSDALPPVKEQEEEEVAEDGEPAAEGEEKKKPTKQKNAKENKNGGHKEPDCEILCCAFSPVDSMVVVATTRKTALIYSLDGELKRAFRIPKAPTSVVFDKAGEFVIIGDRTGNVCKYAVDADKENTAGHLDINGEWSHHEGASLSGAISMVLGVAVSGCGRYLLQVDRDEKLRISRYSTPYVIDSFGLGHSEYVSSVAVAGDVVFTSGGDSTVRAWRCPGADVLAVTERLHPTQPVKGVCVTVQDGKTFVAASIRATSCVVVLEWTGAELKEVARMGGEGKEEDKHVKDMTVVGEKLLVLTGTGPIAYSLGGSLLSVSSSCQELLDGLKNAKDYLANMFKNVTHNNAIDYRKRKADKMEKRDLKRKLNKERKEEKEQAKKAAVGEKEEAEA